MLESSHAARTTIRDGRPTVIHKNRKQHKRRHPQSEGNLALAGMDLYVLPKPKDTADLAMVRHPVQDGLVEYHDSDNLAPARGIFGAIGLSVMLWWLIIFVIYWVYFSLKQSRF